MSTVTLYTLLRNQKAIRLNPERLAENFQTRKHSSIKTGTNLNSAPKNYSINTYDYLSKRSYSA